LEQDTSQPNPEKKSRFKIRLRRNKDEKKTQTKKKKKTEEPEIETMPMKIFVFILTLISMALVMSFLPMFPQPLPLILAGLIAFGVFNSPRLGMTVGGILIGFGLIYHLAQLDFIASLGDFSVRIVFVAVWIAMFFVLPLFVNKQRTVIALDLGIIASMILFSTSLYFMAVPIILVSVVFFSKRSALTLGYYVLISVPLQVIQYFQHISTIARPDWWLEAGSSPTIIVPLNSVFGSLQQTMTQFRLLDTSKVATTIIDQLLNPPISTERGIAQAFKQYMDSFPGIILFVIIVVGMAIALIYLTGVILEKTNVPYGDRVFMPLIASIIAALFFIFLNAMQAPLAYTASADKYTFIWAGLATFAISAPLSFLTYSPKKLATMDMVKERTIQLSDRHGSVEAQIVDVRSNLPVVLNQTEIRATVLRDKLDDVYDKTKGNYYQSHELDKVFEDLNNNVNPVIDDLESQLNISLIEYQALANTQYTAWMTKLKDIGLEFNVKPPAAFYSDLPVDQKIRSIKETLENGRLLTSELINTVNPLYNVIRTLYDPQLPKDCPATIYASKKLVTKEPWLGIDAMYGALNNWRRQYREEISRSIENLQKSLDPIIALGTKSQSLAPLLGDDLPVVLGYAKKAELIKSETQKKPLNVLSLLTLKELMDNFTEISRALFKIFDEKLRSEQQAIEAILPTTDYQWEKNANLNERMTKALQVLFNPECGVNEVMDELPKYYSYLTEIEDTLKAYSLRKEFLLNYPMAERTINEQLKKKNSVSPTDLPFNPKYAAEYLYVFYIQKFREYALEKESYTLTKRQPGELGNSPFI
jgi:hypothetical protein